MPIPPLPLGTVLRADAAGACRYRIEKVLGSGGFGITYRALDTALDATVAIKEHGVGLFAGRDMSRGVIVPHSEHVRDHEKGVLRFEQEARRLHRIVHPNIVRVVDVWRERGTAYYAMTYIDRAQPLPAPNREGWERWPWVRVAFVGKQVLAALSAVHDAGFIHGDIKPDNVLLAKDDRVVVIDFGTSRDADELQRTITTLAYTVDYAPPELMDRARTATGGPWSDLYSWALTVGGLFVQHPTESGAPVDARTRDLVAGQGHPDFYADWRGQCVAAGAPNEWADALEQCVSLDPEARPRDAHTLLDSLGAPEARVERSRHQWRKKQAPRAATDAVRIVGGWLADGIETIQRGFARSLPKSSAEYAAAPFWTNGFCGGRLSRLRYTVLLALVLGVAAYARAMFWTPVEEIVLFAVLPVILTVATIRRGHDYGMTAAVTLALCVGTAFVVPAALGLSLGSTPRANTWGEPPGSRSRGKRPAPAQVPRKVPAARGEGDAAAR